MICAEKQNSTILKMPTFGFDYKQLIKWIDLIKCNKYSEPANILIFIEPR